jgi:hypothetical protein
MTWAFIRQLSAIDLLLVRTDMARRDNGHGSYSPDGEKRQAYAMSAVRDGAGQNAE